LKLESMVQLAPGLTLPPTAQVPASAKLSGLPSPSVRAVIFSAAMHHLTRYQAMAMVKPCPMRSLHMRLALFAASRVDILATTKLAAEPFGVCHNTDEAST
jgi:hypothetical protein